MPGHDIVKLEGMVKEIQADIQKLSQDNGFDEFQRLIHGNGWTTIAEFYFVEQMLQSIHAQVQLTLQLTQNLNVGSGLVGKNSIIDGNPINRVERG